MKGRNEFWGKWVGGDFLAQTLFLILHRNCRQMPMAVCYDFEETYYTTFFQSILNNLESF
jgi:hypothetical protein